jgi:hypothetical protein
VSDELSETERDAFEQHVLECGDCAAALESASLAREALAAAPSGRARRPAPYLAMAASLALALGTGAWLGRSLWPVPAAPVYRGNSDDAHALAVGSVVALDATGSREVARGVVLVTCPAPALQGAEQLDGSLLGPGGRAVWEGRGLRGVSGQLQLAIDLTEQPAGLWTLELRRADLAHRNLQSSSCSFVLR